MECFTDAQGRFVFPGRLFPEVADPAAAPPSVPARRATIEREYGVLKGAGIERNYKWAVSVFQFQDTWGDLLQAERGQEMLAQARRIIDKLASGSTPFAGAANYMQGLLATSDSASRVHYRTALKKGFERAWYRVAVKAAERGDKDSALSRFKRGADRGDSACLYTLGLAHLKGLYKLRQNMHEGLRLIEQAVHGSDADFPRAPYVLGKILLGEGGDVPNGLGLDVGRISVDRERGVSLVQQSAMLGFAPAMLRMGQARQSKEFGFDYAVALRYMSLAAEQEAYRRFRGVPTQLKGDPEANLVKWLLCGYKDVIRVSEQWAFRFAEVGAAERNGTALFALGYFYEVGVNTDTDAAKAIELYREGAHEGCAAASARLEQMATNKPNLRRTLTRQDHDAKLRKHKTALIRGEGDAGLAAINDQSTLESAPGNPALFSKVPSPIPEPQAPLLDAAPLTQPRPPYPESPDRSPRPSATDLTVPHRPSLSSLSSGPSLHSVSSNASALPYPVEDGPADHLEQQSSPAGSFRSAPDRPSLPYPDEYDPQVPLQSGAPLPYPRSPESPRRARGADSEERLTEAVNASLVDGQERKVRPTPSQRSFSSGPGASGMIQLQSSARPQQPANFRRGHGATMSMGNITGKSRSVQQEPRMPSSESWQALSAKHSQGPLDSYQDSRELSGKLSGKAPNRVPVGSRASSTANNGSHVHPTATDIGASYVKSADNPSAKEAECCVRSAIQNSDSSTSAFSVPKHGQNTDSGSNTGFPSIDQGASRLSSSTEAPRRSGSHVVPDAAPVSARASFHNASGDIPNLNPNLPTVGPDPASHRAYPVSRGVMQSDAPRTSSSPSLQAREAASTVSTPMHTPMSSRANSPTPSSGSSDGRSPPGTPSSPSSPGRRRKARPLSSGWVRDSFLPGASRFFSASQPQLSKPGYVDGPETEQQPRQRSPSPLRNMFKSAQDHRSVTDSAVLQKPRGPDPAVANMPKVPVQPIQEKREPGVAYTFEDMGVTTVTSAKNDKCIIA